MKVTFNKFGVCLAFFMIAAYAFFVVYTGACPPDSVTYGFDLAWIVELILLMRIHKDKDDKEGKGLLDKAAPYINEENGEAIAEKLIGVDLKKKKK